MVPSFQIFALPKEEFNSLLALNDDELKAKGGKRMVADDKPGFPCRVSLVDAEPGEKVLLLSYNHHNVDSPYRASGPVFVRENAFTAHPKVNEIPEMIKCRLLSVRAYDSGAMLLNSEIVDGKNLEEYIDKIFADRRVKYLHLHNARPGCFNCRVERA